MYITQAYGSWAKGGHESLEDDSEDEDGDTAMDGLDVAMKDVNFSGATVQSLGARIDAMDIDHDGSEVDWGVTEHVSEDEDDGMLCINGIGCNIHPSRC